MTTTSSLEELNNKEAVYRYAKSYVLKKSAKDRKGSNFMIRKDSLLFTRESLQKMKRDRSNQLKIRLNIVNNSHKETVTKS